jgi:hypothetical protein
MRGRMKLRIVKTKDNPKWYQVQKKFILFWVTIKWFIEYEDACEFAEKYKHGEEYFLHKEDV